ncbi:DUF167 domain-containing protein [Candidatus Vampirococcus lugosii]|uniref:DUF167 domain-containing protein n=1 Tax=Candidatus Vampirococcus lugosii TaxID=2789015 RepID=A0ABS5QKQ2_9BACT|nr:DUF167 domain-containing protein [Candidatus Vampirococcus lugosii]MBS8121694.1 hypothetical protein [Candidatus Vampirococcus lugosii]
MKIRIKVNLFSKKDLILYQGKDIFGLDYYIVYTKSKPIGGQANKSIINLISKYFDKNKSDVFIKSGFKSKEKIIEIK